MTAIDMTALTAALDALPKRYPGPGGVAGVMKDGKIIALRSWGYANLSTARPMTQTTRLPICSISKQFTCAVLLATVADPASLDARVAEYLPAFTGTLPTVRQLCDNQSGLRDYWALTILHGARAEQVFRRDDALPMIARMKTGHFAPGTQYSYCNCNFRILSELIETTTGAALEDLYRQHVWGPAGMKTAVLTADTRRPEDEVVGYEGNDAAGHFPAENAIYWIGDAGISASLDDMMAYEGWIDATRDDPDSLYRRLSARPAFADGTAAHYGMGLAHEVIGGLAFTGHAGALRGFRAQRLHSQEARLSVVVMFNHEPDFHGAAASLVKAALGVADPVPAPVPDGWDGQWISAETGLTARLQSGRRDVALRYATFADTLTCDDTGGLASPGGADQPDGGNLSMTRTGDNASVTLTALSPVDHADGAAIAGRYHSTEIGGDLLVEARDGGVFARFEGMLGTGRMEQMLPAGRDVWHLATRRSMDAPAPGDWTVTLRRDAAGAVTGLRLGSWLARLVDYDRA